MNDTWITILGVSSLVLGIGVLVFLVRKFRKRAIDNLNKTMQSWIGHNKSELLTSWGTPTTVFPNGDGKEIFVYQWTGQTSGYVHKTSNMSAYIEAPRQYTIKREFFIDENGTIYNCRWQGL
jgi:hypothetical protein